MKSNAELALHVLLQGKIITHKGQQYMLSEGFNICRVVKNESNLSCLEETPMTLTEFIKLSHEISRESLLSQGIRTLAG